MQSPASECKKGFKTLYRMPILRLSDIKTQQGIDHPVVTDGTDLFHIYKGFKTTYRSKLEISQCIDSRQDEGKNHGHC